LTRAKRAVACTADVMTAASDQVGAKNLGERACGLAHAVGFDVAGVARAESVPESEYLREWIARGFAGDMHYLENRLELRVDPRRVLPGAQSILAVGLVYDPGPREDAAPDLARIARYAGGEDYHEVIWERLRALEAGLDE
jgi:epoxyqueuosine reductase